MPQYPLALGDLIIHDGGEYYAKILGGRGLPEVSPQMAARYNAWPVAQGVGRSPRQIYLEHYFERLSAAGQEAAKIALYQEADYELTEIDRLTVCDNPIPGAGNAGMLLWFGPWDFYNDGTDDGGDWFARDLLNPDRKATITGMAETVAGRFSTHPAFPVASGTEVNLDAHVGLVNSESYLEFRAVVKMPFANDGAWPGALNEICYIYHDGNTFLALEYNTTGDLFQARIKSGGTTATVTSGAQTFAANTWYDLVLTVDYTSDIYKLYVNGALVDTETATTLATPTTYAQWNLGSLYDATGQAGFIFDTFMVADYACGLQGLYGLDVNPRHVDVLGLGVQPMTVGGVVSDTALVSTHAIDGDVRWRRPGSVELWNVTSSPGSLTVTNNGQDDAYPVINITPRAAKAGGFQYQRWVPVVWKVPTAYTNYHIRIDALNLTGKAQADGDDIRVYSDGSEVDRWLSGTLVSAVTTWFNLSFSANIPMTLDGDITDSATTLVVNEDISSMPATGILMIGTEAITYASKTTLTKTFSGCTRGAKYTTAAAHSNTDAVTWIQHDVFMYYGDASLTAPVVDDDYKPLITLASSSNDSWVFAEFGCTAGTRPGQWSPGYQVVYSNAPASYATYYTANQGTNATPWSEMGYKTFCDASVSTYASYRTWLRFYTPCKITNIAITNGEYKSTSSPGGSTIYVQCGDSVGSAGNLGTDITTTAMTQDDTWRAWTGGGACGAGGNTNVQVWNAIHSGSGGSAVTSYYEFSDCTLTLNSTYTPDAVPGAEQSSSYNLTAVLANGATGESITFNTTLELDDTITIDCDNSTMTNAAGTSLLSGKTLNTVRQHWLRLTPGSNALTYTETGVADVDLSLTWEDRLYE